MTAPGSDSRRAELPVAGASMTPLLRAGDRVGCVPLDPGRLRPGDLVVYRDGEATVCHRFLRARDDGGGRRLFQKGDAISSGSWVSFEQLLGRADYLVIGGRRVELTHGVPRICQALLGVYLLAVERAWGALGLGQRWQPLKRAAQRLAVVPLDLLTRACGEKADASRRRADLTALCALPAPRPEELAARLRGVEDWDDLARMALAHGIQGIALPRLLAPEAADLVPERARAALRDAVLATAAQNLLHKRAILRLLDALPPGVPLLLAKGVALAEFVYDRPSMRPMRDVDFYVRPADVDALERTMAALGYVPEERRRRPREWWIENFQHLEPFVSPDGRVRVEAHLRNASLAMPYRMAMEPAWERSRERLYERRAVRVMAPDDEIAHLILHLYVHDIHLVKLLALCDLDRTVRASADLDWARLVAVAREQGYHKLLHLPLALARELLGTPVPGETLDACRPDDKAGRDVAVLSEYLFRDDIGREQVPFRVTEAMAAPTVAGRWRVLRRALFPTRAELAARYNLPDGSPRAAWYRVAHPFLLARKWGRFALRFLRRDPRQRELMRLSRRVAGWVEKQA